MSVDLAHIRQVMAEADCLFNNDEVEAAIGRVAEAINRDFIDRDVLIIDDILDEGHTLSAIIDFCKHAGARAVHTAVLVDKEHERKARPDLKASFTGLYCADRYVFGYGMDYKGYWRNAAGIFAVKGL
ncbi:TPA: phosphoribosyltransferase family protein [Pseudomonas aeruginosa]